MSAGEGAFAAMSLDGLTKAQAQADALLPCVRELLSPVDAAGIHRLRAWSAWADGDEPATRAALAGARAAQPGWVLPSTLATEGNPLRDVFDAAANTGATRPLAAPAGSFVRVDGVQDVPLPADRAAVVQRVADAGVVEWTGLVRGTDMPDWAADPAAEPTAKPTALSVPAADASAPPERRRGRVALLSATVAGAATTGIVYAAALSSKADYVATDPSSVSTTTELDGLKRRANGLTLTAGGLGLLTGGLAVATGVAWTW